MRNPHLSTPAADAGLAEAVASRFPADVPAFAQSCTHQEGQIALPHRAISLPLPLQDKNSAGVLELMLMLVGVTCTSRHG